MTSSSSQILYIISDPTSKKSHLPISVQWNPATIQLQTRINPNNIPLSRLTIDLKVMPRSYKGSKYNLCMIKAVINYLITVPMHQAKSELGDALIENVIAKYCVPGYIYI